MKREEIEYRSDDVIKMKFVKLWDLLRYSERTTSKTPAGFGTSKAFACSSFTEIQPPRNSKLHLVNYSEKEYNQAKVLLKRFYFNDHNKDVVHDLKR